MSRMVNLYRNCPSSNGHSFIVWPSTRSALLTYLGGDFIKSVDIDNYRLKDDVLILKLFSNYEDVTIITETDTEDTDYFKVYRVDNANAYSDKIYYMLTIDYWLTYINKVSYSDIHVIASSRAMQNTMLPSNLAVNDVETINYQPLFAIDTSWQCENVSKYALLVFVAYESAGQVFSKETASNIIALSIGLDTLEAQIPLSSAFFDGIIATSSIIASTISKIKKGDFEAKSACINAYIVRKSWLSTSSEQYQVTFNFYTSSGAMNTATWGFNVVYPTSSYASYTLNTNNKNKKYYFGSMFKHFPVNAKYPSTKIRIRYTITRNMFRLEYLEGEDTHDLTDLFALSLIGTASSETSLETISRMFTTLSHGVASVGANVASGNYVNAVVGAGDTAFSMLNMPSNIASRDVKGEAYMTFNAYGWRSVIGYAYVRSPLYLVTYDYAVNADYYIRFNGAPCDVYMTLSNIMSQTSIISGSLTYLKGNFTYLQGLPNDILDYIQGVLNKGGLFRYVTD